jgi:hypothetical protein
MINALQPAAKQHILMMPIESGRRFDCLSIVIESYSQIPRIELQLDRIQEITHNILQKYPNAKQVTRRTHSQFQETVFVNGTIKRLIPGIPQLSTVPKPVDGLNGGGTLFVCKVSGPHRVSVTKKSTSPSETKNSKIGTTKIKIILTK